MGNTAPSTAVDPLFLSLQEALAGHYALERELGRGMVTDFGIARVADGGETLVGELLGTPEYMSPEQAAGDAVDARSDVYSLGVVAYYMISGQLPFTAPTIQAVLAKQLTQVPPPMASVAPGIPRSLANAIDTCLIKDPSRRFQSAEAFSDALAPTLVRRREVPVPVRAFLDPRKMWALAVSPAMMMTGGFVLTTISLPHLFTTLGYVGLI